MLDSVLDEIVSEKRGFFCPNTECGGDGWRQADGRCTACPYVFLRDYQNTYGVTA